MMGLVVGSTLGLNDRFATDLSSQTTKIPVGIFGKRFWKTIG